MVSLKVLQLELSPPHTPHLSSCFEEPTVPSHPTLCSLGHRNINKKCSASEHIHLSRSHTLTSHSPRTHTLCGSLYEQRVPSRTILCMKTTSRVSLDWQCRWQRLLAGKQTEKHMKKNSFPPHGYFLHSEWALHKSALRCVSSCLSVWVILQQHGDKNLAVHPGENEHAYFITFITDQLNPENLVLWCFYTNKQVAESL